MSYIVPIHRPSSVRHAVKLDLIHPNEECLVLAKSNRLEVHVLTPEGLHHITTVPVHGTVSSLAAVRPPGSPTSHLFVATAKQQYFTLAWNPSTATLETAVTCVDTHEKYLRDSQCLDSVSVDPSGSWIMLELYEGVLTFVRIMKRRSNASGMSAYLDRPETVRIAETFVISSTFLFTQTGKPKIALLHRDGKERVKVHTYRICDNRDKIQSFNNHGDERDDELNDLDPGSVFVIPVPPGDEESGNRRYINRARVGAPDAQAHLGGLIVVGETRVLYYDDERKATVEAPLEEATLFCSWCPWDNRQWLLADEYGLLWCLTLEGEGTLVTDIMVKKVGQISRPSPGGMIPLGKQPGMLYIGSHDGDSQLLAVDVNARRIQAIQTFPNIAPIMDFTIMDMGNRSGDVVNEYASGQARIVTGSGAFQTGSIRSVRSGVGLEDVGLLGEMVNIRGIFALRSNPNVAYDDVLVVSFLTETRIFRFDDDGEVEELGEFLELRTDQQTLLATNVDKDTILAVTPSSVHLFDVKSGAEVTSFDIGQNKIVTAASANDLYLVLAIDGCLLKSFDLSGKDLTEVGSMDLSDSDEQVACLYVPPQGTTSQLICLVGLWNSAAVSIVHVPSLTAITSTALRPADADSTAVPRHITLAQMLPRSTSSPTLLVAMSDGHVLSYAVDPQTHSLSGQKSVVLGIREADLRLLPRPKTENSEESGLYNVFATSEHSSLIYGAEQENRLVFSAVTAEDATTVCPFNAQAFPESLIVATADNIKVSKIDTQRRTHVSTLKQGATVRRIAYSASDRVFGIGNIKRELVDGREVVESEFRLVGEVTFANLGGLVGLGKNEIIEAVIRTKLPNQYGEPKERFIVGTSFLDEDTVFRSQGYRGRIVVIGIDDARKPYIMTDYKAKGPARVLEVIEGYICVGLLKTVMLLEYNEDSFTSARLEKVDAIRVATAPIDIAAHTGGDRILAVSDLMRSVSLIKFEPGEAGKSPKLSEIARHGQSIWGTAVGHIGGDEWIQGDADGNLMILRQPDLENPGAAKDYWGKPKLEVVGEFGLGESINRIRSVKVEPGLKAVVVPRVFAATTEGTLYLIGSISPSHQDLLMKLQERLVEHLKSPGDVSWGSWRGFRNEERDTEEPFRVVDGELVERFLDLDEGLQGTIVQGLPGAMGVADMRGLVEGLRMLH